MDRRILCQVGLTCAALIGCLTASASAADLSLPRGPLYAPFTWSGFYGGVNVGYGWGNPQTTSLITAFIEPGPAATGVLQASAAGTGSSARSALGGFQAGFNLQSGSWVYGVETDLQVTRLQAAGPLLAASARAFGGIDTASLQTTSNPTASVDWFGTLRARLGFAWNRVLIYGTGGVAYGLTRLNDGVFFNGFAGEGNPPPNGLVAFNSTAANQKDSVLKGGWTGGGGIDYAWTNNIVLSLSYLHVDLGNLSEFSRYKRPSNILGGASTTVVRGWALTGTRYDFDAVRMAVSWKL